MKTATHDAVAAYMKRLNEELRDLPRARREELVSEIRDHIEEAQDEQDAWDEASIRNVLEQIGDPADIAAEARDRFGVQPRKLGLHEVLAIILLLVGGFFAGIGWVVGVVLLWTSAAWTVRDKLIGTLVVPGGLMLPVYLAFGSFGSYTCTGTEDAAGNYTESCTGGPSTAVRVIAIAVVVIGVFGPFFTAAYLSRHARRGAEMPAY